MRYISVSRERFTEILMKNPIFCRSSSPLLNTAFLDEDIRLVEYRRGEIIYCPNDSEKKIIIIASGAAEVYSADDSRNVMLRTLSENDITGVANLFSSDSFVSRIISSDVTQTLEIFSEKIKKLLETDKNVMYGYLDFLSGRISYLNKKIIYLTAGSAERRLANYLASFGGQRDIALPSSLSAIAEMLNIGRASLYRAFDSLEIDGYIKRDGKRIIILEYEKMLERYCCL